MSSAPSSNGDGSSMTSGNLKVVFADDSAATRTLVRHVLSTTSGITLVGEACDGAEALILVEATSPDCVVLDAQMPVLDGFEALAKIRKLHPSLPVVMLSGFASAAIITQAMDRGAAAFIDKSTQLMQLAQTIHRVTATSSVDVPTPAPIDGPTRSDVRTEEAPATASKNRLATATAELRRLEYAVSHDFAEPLRNMRGFATLLSKQYATTLEGSGLLFLHHIAAAAARMQTMIDDLLVYSRAGQRRARADVVDLSEVAKAVVAGMDDRITERSALVSVGQLPAVIGDAEMLTTVFRHLVTNALLFNAAPAPIVKIESSVTDLTAVVTVTDNGFGISPNHHEAIFELFRRLNTIDEFPGTGTGLPLCRRLVIAQGGTIDVLTSTHDGTTFRLVLPRPHDNLGVSR